MISLLAVPITTLLFVLPAMAGSTVATTTVIEPVILTATTTQEIPVVNFDTEIKRLSIKYKFDEKLARDIIECESKIYSRAENKNYRWEWNKELATSTRVHWSSDWGFWQVNDYWHEKTAKDMGYDIKDWKDNLEYGAILLSRDGTRHWKASQYCWKN